MSAQPKPSRRPASYSDLELTPAHLVAELVRGELVTSPRPAARHALAASSLGAELFLRFGRGQGGPGGWIILHEPELHLGDDVLVPDLAGWRRSRMPALPDVPAFTLAPDWICEVLSPSTQALDRTEKLPIYAAAGVAFAWLIDTHASTLEGLRLVDGRWQIVAAFAGDRQVRAEPFGEVELDLALLWSI
jgi:Uma2 family endonuclease